MEISPGIFIIGTSLWIEKEKVLIINDIHIGYEGELHAKGILVPRIQYKDIISEMKNILKAVQPEKIIINGDLKHEFGRISNQEWRDVLDFLDFLVKHAEVIIVQGNHDPIIKPIAEKRKVTVMGSYELEDTLIIHGDELIDTKKRIIIGHEHPAISIKEGSKIEKYKCFLKGKWKKNEVIVVPSFNPLLEGTDVLQGRMLSPFLENVDNFEVFIVSKGEAFNFGKVKGLK
jgi:uncharacterized protein